MKPRRVILTVEIETDMPIKDLKMDLNSFFDCSDVPDLSEVFKVIQIQANVVKKEGK